MRQPSNENAKSNNFRNRRTTREGHELTGTPRNMSDTMLCSPFSIFSLVSRSKIVSNILEIFLRIFCVEKNFWSFCDVVLSRNVNCAFNHFWTFWGFGLKNKYFSCVELWSKMCINVTKNVSQHFFVPDSLSEFKKVGASFAWCDPSNCPPLLLLSQLLQQEMTSQKEKKNTLEKQHATSVCMLVPRTTSSFACPRAHLHFWLGGFDVPSPTLFLIWASGWVGVCVHAITSQLALFDARWVAGLHTTTHTAVQVSNHSRGERILCACTTQNSALRPIVMCARLWWMVLSFMWALIHLCCQALLTWPSVCTGLLDEAMNSVHRRKK